MRETKTSPLLDYENEISPFLIFYATDASLCYKWEFFFATELDLSASSQF